MSTVPKNFNVVERGVEDGVEWFTAKAPMWGAVNGYALLPDRHPWRDLEPQGSDYDKGPNVHGGITYGPTSEGWVGFDTLHSGDVWPGDMPRYGADERYDRHWSPEMVADEARSLARQIAAVKA